MIDHIVFYGTLKSSGHSKINPEIKKSLNYINKCLIPGRLYDLGRLPALKCGNGEVEGELYTIIDQQVLEVLDEYEAVDNEDSTMPGFSRKPITLLSSEIKAWVYYYDGPVEHTSLIESGHWA